MARARGRRHGGHRGPKAARRNSPRPKKNSWLWLGGLIGAGVGIGVAWKVWGSDGAPQQPHYAPVPQSQPQPRLQQRVAGPPWATIDGMQGQPRAQQFDRHGVPVVNLPAESAARTQQARMYLMPGSGAVPSLEGNQVVMDPNTGQQVLQEVPQGAQATERFGGEMGGGFGGENF